jgi:hypothetical protein
MRHEAVYELLARAQASTSVHPDVDAPMVCAMLTVVVGVNSLERNCHFV